ncbi:ATP-binding protein [Actinophytocola algeriensis]|uniref:Serine/threonine-protein kinase RsbW n=1 Tax=Actinophytocola algeriensis TaxID=1768010 RepID=A0A7W7VI43_9PSEU|nr:ATP-binding protein [Actinophytocola algeriensis]MBB4911086.1 serine/threonine-protein kinase RsbW [Actinophytocola algeriensis]MBE1479025.1 serine/threonine-protein kinase RsbW [Actinophytocola algeriensis]
MNLGQLDPDDVPEGELHFRVPAVAARLAGLRHALAVWAGRVGLSDADTEALVLASYEAMANTVEHAYRDQTQGLLDLRGEVDTEQGRVVVTVTDYGKWRPPQPSGGLRGRGLPLIQGLTSTSTITPTTAGTTVTMFWPLPK